MDVAALPAPLETPAEAIDATVDAATMLKAPLMKLRREVSALVTVSPSNISVLLYVGFGWFAAFAIERIISAGRILVLYSVAIP